MIHMPVTFNVSHRGLQESRMYLPMAMFKPHEAQAKKNHDQTLERLAERGGLNSGEAVAILKGHRLNEEHKYFTDILLAMNCLLVNWRRHNLKTKVTEHMTCSKCGGRGFVPSEQHTGTEPCPICVRKV